MIKAVLFDYDGVITIAVPDSVLPERLARNLGVAPDIAAQWLKPMWGPLLRAEITDDECWMALEEKYGQRIERQQRDIWFKWPDLLPLPEMLDEVRRLKTDGFKVGVLSNATLGTYQEILKHGGYDEFDFQVISCQVGLKKPEPEIFQLALKQLDAITANEVLFLDDRLHNVQAARALGMQAMHVSSAAQAIANIARLTAEIA